MQFRLYGKVVNRSVRKVKKADGTTYDLYNMVIEEPGAYPSRFQVSSKVASLFGAALAAPARNCDVPHKDDHELWLRWQAFCAEIYPSRMSFSTWLLDLAQEGGAK